VKDNMEYMDAVSAHGRVINWFVQSVGASMIIISKEGSA